MEPGILLPFSSLDEVLEDLASRFILNLPPAEQTIERILFQIQEAHWYLDDFIRPNTRLALPHYHLRTFTSVLFQRCAFLRAPGGPLAGWTACILPLLCLPYRSLTSVFFRTSDAAYDKFMHYKERVPVCGAIILNSALNKCLLVKGYKSGATWSFPRGKINQDESERNCAIREVWEETGFSAADYIRSDPSSDVANLDFFEITMRQQRLRLYLVVGVPEDWPFAPQTRQEISVRPMGQ